MALYVLDATTKKLQAKIGGAPATTNPDFVAAFADDTGTAFTEGSSVGALNGSTVVDIVAAPAASTRRVVKSVSIFNSDTASVVLTVYYNDNGTQRVIFSGTLAVGAVWVSDLDQVLVPDIASLADIVAERSAIATLTNKTITSPLGLVKGDVGLGNVDNTSDATKNAATVTLTNKTLTSPAINTPTGIVKGDVGLGNVDNTSDATKNAATVTLTNKTLTSPAINTPTGIVKGDVGLGNVDNTSNATERAATATLTNKRITKRSGSTTSSATPTINTDNVDFYALTAQTADITSFTTNLSGTPSVGDTLWIAITGTAARAITWGASFEASTVALPTTTVTTARLDVGFVWNDATSKWRCIAVS